MQLTDVLDFIEYEEELFHENIGKSTYRKRNTPLSLTTARMLRDLGLFNVTVESREEGRALWEYYCSVLPNPKRVKNIDLKMIQLMLLRGQPILEKYSTKTEQKNMTDLYFDYLVKREGRNHADSKNQRLVEKLCLEYVRMFRYKIEKKIYNKNGRLNPDTVLKDVTWIEEELRFISSLTEETALYGKEEGFPIWLIADKKAYYLEYAKIYKAVADLYSFAAIDTKVQEQAAMLYDKAIKEYTAYADDLKKNPKVRGLINDCKTAKENMMKKLAQLKI